MFIVINDIVQRYKIKKIQDFRKVVDYVLVCNARKYSANSIYKTMKNQGVKCSSNTIQKWISYIEEAFVIDEIYKYSKKAKRKLEQARKIYNSDVALTVFDNNGKEIDFLAEKDNKKYYIQVAYSVLDKKAYKREFDAFKNVSQIDTKIIITNDDLDYSTSNVRHIKLKDFLINGID